MDKLFINTRYIKFLTDYYDIYINNNGVFKKVKKGLLFNKSLDNTYFCLEDLPKIYQNKFMDLAISASELNNVEKRSNINDIYDSEKVRIFVSGDTEILPIVGNLLPSDGTHAYEVVEENNRLYLNPILVCWNCHWADLFSGSTKYGDNVFCLASELSKEQREFFADEIICLKDAIDFLESKHRSI